MFISVNMMHDFSGLKRSPKHLFGYNTVRVPAMDFSISCRLNIVSNSFQVAFSAFFSMLFVTRNIIWIPVSTYSLSVHCAHSFAFNPLVASVNATFDRRHGSSSSSGTTQLSGKAPA